MKTGRHAFRKTLVAQALLTAFCGSAFAQAQPSSLQRVEVTGSNIKRTDTETASPVTILTREDIERTGRQSIQEVLRGITADSQGSIPTAFTAGFASGSAAVSLRGLGVNSTLVLVNGRRMTTYGLADDGTRNFVDLNSLPLEAVERIEVLKDGGSAIYGADAVGGVVNVILRKNYVGKAVGITYGAASRGDGQTVRGFGSVGFGDIDTDRYNVFLSIEGTKQKNIWSVDRGYLGQSDLSRFDFYDTTNGAPRPWIGSANPSINSPYGVTRGLPVPGAGQRVNLLPCPGALLPNGFCGYNPLVEQEIQPKIERLNVFARGTMQINANMTGYAEFGVFNSKTSANGTLGANNDTGVFKPGDPLNPLVTHDPMILPASHPQNTFGVDRVLGLRPAELGGRDQVTDNSVYRFVAGVQGASYGWDYDFGLGWIKSRLKNTNTGYIIADEMQAALDNGTYRIGGGTAPAVLARISPALTNTPTSSVKLMDLKLSRELGKLDGGPIGLALGGETRWEEANTPPVPFTDTGSVIGLGYSAFTAKRRVSAIFGEVELPVTKWLEFNGALRYDHYSDFGNSTTPKAGFKLKPFDGLAVRGTYAQAFRAPGPAERGGSSFGFTTVGILSQGNPNIAPETAKSSTLGFILEPTPGTSATIDFWKISRKNEIVQADPAAITAGVPTNGVPLSQVPGAQPNSFVYYDSDGNIATVTGFYRNAAKTNTNGFDMELRHKLNLGGGNGKLTAQLNWTHVNKFNRTDPDGNTFEYAGTHGPIVLSSGSGTPKDRASFSLTYEKNPWSVTGMVNYVGSIKMIDHKGEMAADQGDGTVVDAANGLIWNWDGTSSLNCGVFTVSGKNFNGNCKLPSFMTFDLYGKWSPMKNLDINVSVQNVFDKKAPLDPYLVLSYGVNYNQGWHQSGAVGRMYTVGAKYSF